MRHPQVNDPNFRKQAAGRDLGAYVQYVKNQLGELLTDFGDIDILWFDFSFPEEDRHHAREIIEMVRELQPGIIMNERLSWWEIEGGTDHATPEGFHPRAWIEVDGQRVPWEVCTFASGFWSYYPGDDDWKSPDQLIRMLIDTVSKGGNLLLNFGPNGRGELDIQSQQALAGIADWMKRHGRAIHGCTQAPDTFVTPPDCRLTYNPETNRLYVHILAWPVHELHLEGLGGKVAYAQFLHDASEVRMETPAPWRTIWEKVPEDTLTLALPTKKPEAAVPVIELYLE
jgi:alpha-L-fucosidase